MSNTSAKSPIILIPGHWLGAWAWEEVVERLHLFSHHTYPLTLPGLDPQDPDRACRTLAEQADAIEKVLYEAGASAQKPAVLVGHSAANGGPISLVLDRHPELVRRVIWVDSGPVADGFVFAPDIEDNLVDLPLPDFEVLKQQTSLEGLDAAALSQFRRRSVPEPGPVLRGSVNLTNDERPLTPRHRLKPPLVARVTRRRQGRITLGRIVRGRTGKSSASRTMAGRWAYAH